MSVELEDFITFRKTLHQHPEVSGDERHTRDRVLHFVKQFHPDTIIPAGKNGLIFVYEGNEPGRAILLRAEMDALPIQEVNKMEHVSTVDNVSHLCGHDGHMAILSRVAFHLSKEKIQKGTVYLLFQPAEETGEGAKEVYASKPFRKLKIDQVIALHNVPAYPLNSIIVKENTFTPAVSSIIVHFKGKTSHAAEPEMGVNPAEAIAAYIKRSLALAQPQQDKEDFFLVTPIYMQMGEKSYGVSAGYGEVHLTIRSTDNHLLHKKSKELEEIAGELATQFGLGYSIRWTQEFSANENDAEVVDDIRKAAKALDLKLIERSSPMKWGEDFGLFTSHYKGAMFGLGAGVHQPALHNPDYDFPDELIETGSRVFEQLIRDFLKK